MQTDQKKQNARKILIKGGAKFSWFFIIFFSIFLFFVSWDYVRIVSLEEHKVETEALITRRKTVRAMDRSWVKGYRIRYKLIIDKHEYTHTDFLGRDNLWTKVYPDTYNASYKSDSIKVIYHKDRPWINEAAGMLEHVKTDSLLAVITFLILIGIAVFLLILTKIYRKKWNVG